MGPGTRHPGGSGRSHHVGPTASMTSRRFLQRTADTVQQLFSRSATRGLWSARTQPSRPYPAPEPAWVQGNPLDRRRERYGMHDPVSSVASLALHADLTYGGGRQLVIRSGERVIAAHRSPSGACLQWLELTLSGDSGQLAAGSLPKTASSSPLRRECRPEPESPVPNALSGIFRLSARLGTTATQPTPRVPSPVSVVS